MEAWSLKRACTVGVEASVFPGLPVLCSVITMPQIYIFHNILLSCTGLHLLTILKSQRHSRRRKALAYACGNCTTKGRIRGIETDSKALGLPRRRNTYPRIIIMQSALSLVEGYRHYLQR